MRTGLYERHLALGAKIIPFAGWEMPIHYRGIIEEHHTVRKHVGIFDVSHMGKIEIKGPDAEKLLDYLSTNAIVGKKNFSATYTTWVSASGATIDDLIVYKHSSEHFVVIVNASNREKDLAHLCKIAASFNVTIENRYSDGILALQGPKALTLASKLFKEVLTLKPMHFMEMRYLNADMILSATGYTGAGGIEIYAPMPLILDLWDRFLELGRAESIQPIGLGARDTLRLEMGYALYGHELSETIAPTESVSAWTVKWESRDFLGKDALLDLEKSPKKRHQYGIELIDPGIAREGYPIFQNDTLIGTVTSGTFSPTLNQAIAIIMVESLLSPGDVVDVQIRGNKARGKVVKLPFLTT